MYKYTWKYTKTSKLLWFNHSTNKKLKIEILYENIKQYQNLCNKNKQTKNKHVKFI